MILFAVSFFAGMLTILAPCILPILPVVIGSTGNSSKSISKKTLIVIGSLSISVLVFTLLLKATTAFIDIPQSFWSTLSGVIIIVVGISFCWPEFWAKLPLVGTANKISNQVLGVGYQKKSYIGDIMIGTALGPVFTTCSPTYFFILATILPASFIIGIFYLIVFIIGLAIALLLIAYFGERLIGFIISKMDAANIVKKILGVLIIVAGLSIITGYDKKISTYILNLGYGATINFEENLLKRFYNE